MRILTSVKYVQPIRRFHGERVSTVESDVLAVNRNNAALASAKVGTIVMHTSYFVHNRALHKKTTLYCNPRYQGANLFGKYLYLEPQEVSFSIHCDRGAGR